MSDKKGSYSRRDFIRTAGAAGLGSALLPFGTLNAAHGTTSTASLEPKVVPMRPYQTDNTIYMVHGPYYVEILSTMPSGTHIFTLKQLAERFIRDTPVDKRDLHLLSVFPSENQVEGSASMIARDAFGFDLLDNVFTVAYDADAGRSTAYVSKRKSAEEARTLVSKLHNFFAQYDGRSIETGIGVEGARMIEIMGTFEVMFSFGEYFAGVHEAPDRNQAKKVALLLAESLKKKTGETAY